MGHSGFVHLRVHSAYSLSEGAIKIKSLIELCRRDGMPAVAVTDTGNLFGALEFSLAARDAGVQPIIGCQIAIAREGAHFSGDPEEGEGGAIPAPGPRRSPDQLVLLVQDEVGYRNLLRLVSKSFLDGAPGDDPQLPMTALEGMTDGLIALTGGPAGRVGRLLLEGQDDAAETTLARLARLFPDRLYVELMRHGQEAEDRIESRLIDLAYAHDLPLVATNEAFFGDADMYEAHDALLCIAAGAYVGQGERRRVTPEHWFKPAAAMRELFADLPEAVDNTLVIAQRCAFMPEPCRPILPAFPVAEGQNEAEELRLEAERGLERRLEAQVYRPEMDDAAREEVAKPYRERLSFELGVINQMGFPGYFLIVADFIQWAKRQGIPVGPGRGSGAGSVVAWALTITDLDPLRFGLLFERFLNPERVSMPDFDVDFCQDRRDEVIRYVQEKYGRDRVAQIITFGKLQARAVLRDVGRVLQMSYGQVDRLCKMVPNNPANPVTLQQAIDGEPMLRELRDQDESVGRLIDIALKLEGLYRHASTHAAGIVIGDRPLDELVPLYRDPRSDMPVTQFNMKFVEQAGLVKFDFLGLKTLTVLARARDLIAERGESIDLSNLPLDDAKSYEMIGRGESTGVFQLESSGMRDVLRKMKPDRFEDIIAVVALYRPGPMDNIPSYIARKHGEEEPDYLHPTLEGILKETFGIMIYQEQVMQIAQELSGYSLGTADLLRRAMGKKIKAEMEAQRKIFVDGAVARGVRAAKAEQVFDQVNKFAGYGFNKSHAAAYALVAYQTAWLKANYPVEFFAASMTLDYGNTDKLNVFRQELGRLKIRLLPPDINRSRASFGVEIVEGGVRAIRYALAAIKSVGAGAVEALVRTREAEGAFKSLFDFTARLDPRLLNRRQLETLVCAGAFDGLNPNRRQTFEAAETILRHANAAASERESLQVSLFGDGGGEGGRFTLPAVADWPSMERLRHEFEAIGFYLSAHPLDAYGKTLERLEVVPYVDLPVWMSGRTTNRAKLAGIVINRQERTSSRGNRFAFVQLSDASGMFEVMVFSDLLATERHLLEPGQAVLIGVEVRSEDGNMRLTGQSVRALDEAVTQATTGLRIFLNESMPLDSLCQVMQHEGRGRGRIRLVLEIERAREVEMALPGAWSLSAATRAAIKAIPGVVDVQDL
ncbi:DNA polymerase III subunit alpha [Rhodospirillaceae bacterium SYSU D60014]|uniref:DNA polymerase III subunit alpha n=1 Tax=Virgifigura deserti TaxID=2268457 RepID=UPI000E66827B